MDRFRGGLMSSTGVTALASGARGRFRDAEIDEGGGGGDDLDTLLEAPVDDKGDKKDEAVVVEDPEAHDGSIVDVPEFLKIFSADKGEKKLSNQEYLAKRGFKDVDGVVASLRETERSLRERGAALTVPGKDATPEAIKAYREALGVPEDVKGYEVKLPEGLEGRYALDDNVLDPLREVAHANNVPASAFDALAGKFMEAMAESEVAEVSANNGARDAKLKEWGTDVTARKEEFKRGAKALGLDVAAIQKMQAGFGVGETMDLLARVGSMTGEDFFADGEASQRFGVADLESAQKALDAMTGDPEVAKKLRDKSDPNLVAKYKRLIGAVSHYREKASKE